jgi:glyoxylase-like metal-dependent hydrolase (beta-lactamase superfamily II)
MTGKRIGKMRFALLLLISVTSAAGAQMNAGPAVLTSHLLKGGVYWVGGGVANTGFIVGDKGVIVFDAQMTPEAAKLQLAEIAKVTSKPVDTVVVSHSDPDHIGGLPGYPAGVSIIAQENTTAVVKVSALDPTGDPVNTARYKDLMNYLPTRSIAETENAVIDGVRMQLIFVAPAHTSGDLSVYLPAQKIVFAGDVITTNTGRFPIIHLDGSSLGWIATMKTLLALKADTYVPGHGPMETKAQLEARLMAVEERREQVKAMVAQNKSLAEVLQALPEPGAIPVFPSFTQTVYKELTTGYPTAHPPWMNFIKKP